ncbi:MAG: discoidin domain-containing protein [Planctomycetes bacterium]|nr:discoidin domain-containing protein [Planctomycetota bacterium]
MTISGYGSTEQLKNLSLLVVALLAAVLHPQNALGAVTFSPDAANELSFPAQKARYVRLVIVDESGSQTCIDELEVYGQGTEENLALASRGAKATASSCLPGYRIHRVEHLNDGLYSNRHSWIAAGQVNEWAQIELPQARQLTRVVFSRDREGQFRDRMPHIVEVRLSMDGRTWQTACRVKADLPPAPQYVGYVPPAELPEDLTWDALLHYAFVCERDTWRRMNATDHLSPLRVERPALPGGKPYWGRIAKLDALNRVLAQMEEMSQRLAAKGLNVSAEMRQLAELRSRQTKLGGAATDKNLTDALYMDARLAKRNLMLRDPDLAPLQRILFAKRHPYLATHNYSDVLDSQFRSGGGICVLDIPNRNQRLDPSAARVTVLFDASEGIARDPMPDFEAQTIYFSYRPASPATPGQASYWHLMSMRGDASEATQITDGPFHDYFPCPLPDGGLAFITTRCRARFLCWRPQAFVLFRMGPNNPTPRPLSFANISEWTPETMRDGRLLWTRSEYQDKGANFGHTLWAIHPDGTHPELVYGNNTNNCYMNAHEVPGTNELCCTLVSHGGDHNGPIGLINLSRGPFDPTAITSITPDIVPQYDMSWLRAECFRDPMPVARDYFLVSHAPADRFGLYVIDRYGNRELLYMDPNIASMRARPLRPVKTPQIIAPQEVTPDTNHGQFTVADVYQGLSPTIARGQVKYLRVCQEVRADLEQLQNGEFRHDHEPFQDYYATPIHLVNGPNGWPSYVAKASLGLAPVEEDGSANFYAPAGKVLYFQALDRDYNELQRMRSVIQLQPGERRGCVGCHEDRKSSAPRQQTIAARRMPSDLLAPPWGAEPFAYEKIVQPVWDAQCVRCHDATDKQGFDLTGTRGADHIPASYRTLITGAWVHYFDWGYAVRHRKAEPASFGTLKSRLFEVLDAGHYDVALSREDMRRVKCWIDLNCPLWPDYTYRLDRHRTGLAALR